MKLSEAIRLGSMASPQAFEAITRDVVIASRQTQFFGTVEVLGEARCALGAAFHAAGCASVTRIIEADGTPTRPFRGVGSAKKGDAVTQIHTPAHWPMHFEAGCPVCPDKHDTVYRLIPHLNDVHLWTREQIADWLEPIEDSLTALRSMRDAAVEVTSK